MNYRSPNIDKLIAAWQVAFPEDELAVQTLPLEEKVIAFPPEHIAPAARILVEQFHVTHLSALTADDTGAGITLLYHFWAGYGITLRTRLPYKQLQIATLTDLIPGAAFYEREVQELLGIIFEGHPEPRRLLMPDDWQGEHPLRTSDSGKENDE